MAAPAPANAASNQIITRLDKQQKALEDLDKELKTQFTEVLQKLNEIITRQSASGTKARGASGNKSTTATSDVSAQKKFFTNTMYWIRDMWKRDRAAVVKICSITDKQLKDIERHMSSTEANKAKSGDTKLTAEADYYWATYVKNNNELKKKTKDLYDAAKQAFEKETKTPAKDTEAAAPANEEEESAEPAAADEEADE
jgi:hypothetical protein